MVYNFMRALLRILSSVWFDLRVYGKENVPRTGGVLLVANHQSFLDPAVLGVQLPRKASFLAKSELFDNPVFGWIIRRCNAFPVRQGEGDVGAVKETIRRLQEGHMLTVFPEGGRCEDGELQPILNGAALVVRKAQVPIVPVVIEGSFKAWSKHRKIWQRHPIRVLFGKPAVVHHMKAKEITAFIEQQLHELLAELRAKIAQESRS
ncbi:MAG TPA: lysophospholipid acyltransferase family protein [Tepidisphaeraceae bacterium]|nr:lysophospholipid acyltransferase family protein [Tepidisphaeraceae bacterium]